MDKLIAILEAWRVGNPDICAVDVYLAIEELIDERIRYHNGEGEE